MSVLKRSPPSPLNRCPTAFARRALFRLSTMVCGRCMLCDEPCALPPDLCDHCLAILPWNTPACRGCGQPTTSSQRRCDHCDRQPGYIEQTLAPLRYESIAAQWVVRAKGSKGRLHARVLGQLLSQAAKRTYPPADRPQRIIPVPLSRRRLFLRGHNQATLIAHPISVALGIPLDTRSVIRVGNPPAQHTLSRVQRLANLSDAFKIRRPVRDLHIALVDDVMTTGATLNALAAVLLEAGASKVHAWVATRTPAS